MIFFIMIVRLISNIRTLELGKERKETMTNY